MSSRKKSLRPSHAVPSRISYGALQMTFSSLSTPSMWMDTFREAYNAYPTALACWLLFCKPLLFTLRLRWPCCYSYWL